MPSKRPAPLSDAMFKPAGPSGPPTSAAPEPQAAIAPAVVEAKGVLGATFNGVPLPVKNTFIDMPSGLTPSGMKSASLAKAQPVMTAPADLSMSHGFIKRAITQSVSIAPAATNGVAPAATPVARRTAVPGGFQSCTPLSTPSPTMSLMGFPNGGFHAVASSATGPSAVLSGFSAYQVSAPSVMQPPQAPALPSQVMTLTSVAAAPAMAPALPPTLPPTMAPIAPAPVTLTAPSAGTSLMSTAPAPQVLMASAPAPAPALAPVLAPAPARAPILQPQHQQPSVFLPPPPAQSPKGSAQFLYSQPVQYAAPPSVLGGAMPSKVVEEENEDEDGDDDSDAELPPHLRNPADAPLPPPGAIHPSLGSEAHLEGACKRCCFYPRGRCTNGYDCEFCHYEHEKRKRKNKKKKKKDPGAAVATTAVVQGASPMVGGIQGQEGIVFMGTAPPMMTTAPAPLPEPRFETVFSTAPPAQLQPPEVVYSTAPSVVQTEVLYQAVPAQLDARSMPMQPAPAPAQVVYSIEAPPPAPPVYAAMPQQPAASAELAPVQLGPQGFTQYTVAPPTVAAPAAPASSAVLASAPPPPMVLLSSQPAAAPVLRTAPTPPLASVPEAVVLNTQPRPATLPLPPAMAPAPAATASASQAFMPPAPMESPKFSKGLDMTMPPPMQSPKLCQGGMVFEGPSMPPPQGSPRFPRSLAQEVQQTMARQAAAANGYAT